jgi:hypothetical protein
MLCISYCQVPVAILSYNNYYKDKLKRLNSWLSEKYPEQANNITELKVNTFAGTEYFDKIAELYAVLDQLPVPRQPIEEIDFGYNPVELYLTHQSLKPIDFEINGGMVDYKHKDKSIRTRINRKIFTINDYWDLLSSYMMHTPLDPEYYTQIQFHLPTVARYNGREMVIDSFKFLKSNYLY